MSNISKLNLFLLLKFLTIIQGFIPHPSIRVGGQAGESITHTEITQIAFVRSLARYFLETKAIEKYEINNKEYTIDELYHLTYPKWSKEKLHIHSYPLKSILDTLLSENALVDMDRSTKKLPAAHFDSEAFSNASRRMIKIRNIIINDVINKSKDLSQARQLLGQLLHTLQDFYSHSNWIELGKTEINEHLGINIDIGPVATPNQSTCTSKGCITKRVKCSFLQKITLNKCPLEYYECKNNIRPEIIKKGLLTSGYSVNQHNEDNEPISKPTNVEKCSHGSVMDTSSHLPAIGGINKDTIISIYSPHFDLHYEAATMAVLATERFFNDLRKDLGDEDFDRLFAIHPTAYELNLASQGIAQLRKFRFFTSSLSSGIHMGKRLINNIKQVAKKRWSKLKWALFPNSNDLTIEDMLQEAYLIDDDDDGGNSEKSQTVPSCALDSVVVHNTSTTQPILDYCTFIGNNHISSPGLLFQEMSIQHACDVPIPMQCPIQEDIIYENTNNQQPEGERPMEMAEVPDKKNNFDEHCVSVRCDRHSTTSNSSNDDQNGKPSSEIIDKQSASFPHKHVILSTHWYLYRINISNNGDLGFIVPCELTELPMFNLYDNDDTLIVQVVYIRSINYTECEDKLEVFCQYLFEKVFDDMNTGSSSILKFDLKNSTFKLLPCFLKKSGEIDYQRMESICTRKNKLIQDPCELNNQEIYTLSTAPNRQFYISAIGTDSKKRVCDSRKDVLKVAVKRMEKPRIDYLERSEPPTNKRKSSDGLSNKVEYYPITVLRYAPLNQPDCELISKFPSIFIRISQLNLVEQLRKLLIGNIPSYSSPDAGQMPIVTFGDCLTSILSSNQSTTWLLDSLNCDLLLTNTCECPLSPDLLFQSITGRSAAAKSNMRSLATLGDSFLELVTAMSYYHRYPSDDIGELTKKKKKQVSNAHLYQLAAKKELKPYINSIKIVFHGENANWIPPGYTTDEDNSERYLKQKVERKSFADMIEALFGAFLISTNCSTTIKFMKGLGLDVIPTDEEDGVVKIPSVFRINRTGSKNESIASVEKIYNERLFLEIETKINYIFKDKAYLIAAFTHPSYFDNAVTINYERLKFVGNALLKFLITRYTFLTKKSVTSDHVTKVHQDLLNNNRKGSIMVANDLHKNIICTSPKLITPTLSNADDEDSSIDENNINQGDDLIIPQAVADVFGALIAAIFFDSDYSLKTVWDIIGPLFQRYGQLDSSIENPNINVVRLFRERGGKITNESEDDNGNFTCSVELPDGTKGKGTGKSKKIARQCACNIVKK